MQRLDAIAIHLVVLAVLAACARPEAMYPTPVGFATDGSSIQTAPRATSSSQASPRGPTTLPSRDLTRSRPSTTPTFDVLTIASRTPGPPVECPRRRNLSPPVLLRYGDPSWFLIPEDFEDPILAFLDAGGASEILRTALTRAGWLQNFRTQMLEEDVTGDGVKETLISVGDAYVFGCIDGHYQLLLNTDYNSHDLISSWFEFAAVEDMNLDGTQEIVLADHSCHACGDIRVLEWTGSYFENLILYDPTPLYRSTPGGPPELRDYADMVGINEVQAVDVDGNGTLELLLRGGIATNFDFELEGPWRVQTQTYMWDGNRFGLYRVRFDPPEFRFQAVQDGDLATIFGDYVEARDRYVQAIHDDALDWWSLERHENIAAQFEANIMILNPDLFETPPVVVTPTPVLPNLQERDQLSGYAYFRIVVLDLVEGQPALAALDFLNLRSSFSPLGSARPYMEMASNFWEEYRHSQDIGSACLAARKYAVEHRQILEPLGGFYHGIQSHLYGPNDVCPFH